MTTEPTDAELKALWQIHAADIGGSKSYPLADFQEGQWWVNELDAMASHPIGQAIRVTPDMRRAVAVVHNLLRAATAPQPSPTAQAADSAGWDADRIVKWSDRIQRAHPKSEPEFWPDALRVKYMADEISDLRAAIDAARKQGASHD